jgi:RNA polymerase sigma-70 factor (ECF subfamily)
MQTAYETPQVQTSQGADTTGAAVCAIDLEQLYRKHHLHLRRFIQRHVRNPEDAEDLLQNTFVEATRCASQFSGMSKPSTWLFGIALNLARNHIRRSHILSFEVMDDAILEQIVDINGDPAMLLELRQIAGKVETMLNELPETMRETLSAVLGGESSYEQAATELNIPIGTIRSRVSRVRAAMRAQCA